MELRRVWDAKTSRVISTMKHPDEGNGAMFSAAGDSC